MATEIFYWLTVLISTAFLLSQAFWQVRYFTGTKEQADNEASKSLISLAFHSPKPSGTKGTKSPSTGTRPSTNIEKS